MTRGSLEIETSDPIGFAHHLPVVAHATSTRLIAVEPSDEDLESIYGYLTDRSRGSRR
jgi:hypothetical protein